MRTVLNTVPELKKRWQSSAGLMSASQLSATVISSVRPGPSVSRSDTNGPPSCKSVIIGQSQDPKMDKGRVGKFSPLPVHWHQNQLLYMKPGFNHHIKNRYSSPIL